MSEGVVETHYPLDGTYERRQWWCQDCCFPCVLYFTRVWGIFTAIVLGGVGSELIYHGDKMGIYVLVISTLTLFLEVMWVVNLFLKLLLKVDYHWSRRCWETLLRIDTWKKGIIYLICSIPLFILVFKFWLAPIAGSMLLALGFQHCSILYFSRLQAQATLLHMEESLSDRLNEDSDGIDVSIPEPIVTTPNGDLPITMNGDATKPIGKEEVAAPEAADVP